MASGDAERIRLKILGANKIVFLGFAFHELNLDLIRPTRAEIDDANPGPKVMFGTGLGMAEYAQSVVKQQLFELSPANENTKNIFIDDAKCADLFTRYGMGFKF